MIEFGEKPADLEALTAKVRARGTKGQLQKTMPFQAAKALFVKAFSVSGQIADLNLRISGAYTPDAAALLIDRMKNEGLSPLSNESPEKKAWSALIARLVKDTGRPYGAVMSALSAYHVTLLSPKTDVDEVENRLRRVTWTRKEMCGEISRRSGYSPGTVDLLMSKAKLDYRSAEAVEAFAHALIIRKEQKAANLRASGGYRAPVLTEQSNNRSPVVREQRGRRDTRNQIWQPDALPGEPPKEGKQFDFLQSVADIVGMEGGKGSGKTDLLIFDCIRPEKVLNPLWHGVIFRREYKRLVEVIDRARYWMSRIPQLRAHWQGSESRFVFPSGAWLGFHNVEHLGDEQKYQGWQIVDLKFDQLEEFEEQQFDYLMLQNRSGDPVNLSPTVRFTANPMGIGHKWVKRRFIDGKEPGIVHDITVEIDGITYRRTFKRIHSTVFDNPLLAKDERYIATLATDPNPIRRKAMFRGDWDVVLGQFFNEFTSEVHVIPSSELSIRWRRVAGLDYGSEKVMEFLARDHEGNIYVEWEFCLEPDKEAHPNGYTAGEFAEKSAEFMLERGIGSGLVVIADNNMWSATGRDVGSDKIPALMVQAEWNKRFADRKLPPPILIPVSKRSTEEYRYRVACNEATRSFLRYEIREDGTITRQPKLFFMKRAYRLIETLPSLVADESDPMDIADAQYDHAYDAFKMPFMQVFVTAPPPKEATAESKWAEQHRQVEEGALAQARNDWRIAGW